MGATHCGHNQPLHGHITTYIPIHSFNMREATAAFAELAWQDCQEKATAQTLSQSPPRDTGIERADASRLNM